MSYEAKVKRIREDAPPEAVFVGYGGVSTQHETLVFSYLGIEVRFPIAPLGFYPHGWKTTDEIEAEYGCLSAEYWRDVEERVGEITETG